MYRLFLIAIFLLNSAIAVAQQQPPKPKMTYMGAFDSGQAGVSVHKLFDPTEDVVCYLLMPDQAGRKVGVDGGWIYDGNSVGAMSCVKARVQIAHQQDAAKAPSNAKQRK